MFHHLSRSPRRAFVQSSSTCAGARLKLAEAAAGKRSPGSPTALHCRSPNESEALVLHVGPILYRELAQLLVNLGARASSAKRENTSLHRSPLAVWCGPAAKRKRCVFTRRFPHSAELMGLIPRENEPTFSAIHYRKNELGRGRKAGLPFDGLRCRIPSHDSIFRPNMTYAARLNCLGPGDSRCEHWCDRRKWPCAGSGWSVRRLSYIDGTHSPRGARPLGTRLSRAWTTWTPSWAEPGADGLWASSAPRRPSCTPSPYQHGDAGLRPGEPRPPRSLAGRRPDRLCAFRWARSAA